MIFGPKTFLFTEETCPNGEHPVEWMYGDCGLCGWQRPVTSGGSVAEDDTTV